MKKPRIIMVILCLCICQAYGCSGGTGGFSEGADTGSIRFSIRMPSAGTYTFRAGLSPGNHTYYFALADGRGGSARLPLESAYSHTTTVECGYFVAPPP